MRRLDDIADEIALGGNLFIKVDVQGFERNVIAGGRSTFERACIVMIETSFLSLYEGQLLFDDIYAVMRSMGFEFRGNLQQMLHAADGRVVQADSIFDSPLRDSESQMNVIIIGCSGLIGSEAVLHFDRRRHRVFGIDNSAGDLAGGL